MIAEATRVGSSIGQYKIVREIGRGGMGVVYEAVHDVIGQRAAIKMMSFAGTKDPDFFARFQTEARAASAVQHPGLVKVFDFGCAQDGAPFLMMEYVEGETLRARLQRVRTLSVAAACRVARQIAAALAAIHALGIVHRDLKPENVMLVADDAAEGGERIKLLDFGIARRVAGESWNTSPGLIVGTPPYMSPEQCASERLDTCADIYALGVLLHEMLLGSPPFVGDSARVMRQHLIEDVVLVPDERIPADVRQIALRMLAKDRGARPTAAAVEEELRQVSLRARPVELAPTELHAVAGSLPPKLSRSRRPFRKLGAAALIAMATLGIVWGALRRPRAPGRPPADLTGMVWLAGGTFTMGRTPEELGAECVYLGATCRKDALEREQPAHSVTVSPVYLDAYEVTNSDFATWLNADPVLLTVEEDPDLHTKRFVFDRAKHVLLVDLWPGRTGVELHADGTIGVRAGFERKPVVQVTWDAARMFCEARGKRLPTEAEWELAARGDSSRRYPWGDAEPTCGGVVLGRAEGLPCANLPSLPEDVGAAPQDWTPTRIAGLGGNVSEWVFDAFDLPYYAPCGDCIDPRVDHRSSVVSGASAPSAPDATDEMRVFRGGAWANTIFARSSARGRWKRASLADNIGFRCAADAVR